SCSALCALRVKLRLCFCALANSSRKRAGSLSKSADFARADSPCLGSIVFRSEMPGLRGMGSLQTPNSILLASLPDAGGFLYVVFSSNGDANKIAATQGACQRLIYFF